MRSSPLSIGFRAILRRPALFFMEVAWRWVFGALACGAVFYCSSRVRLLMPLSEADTHAWGSRDFFLITQAFLHVLRQLRGESFIIVISTALAVSVLWVVLSTAGRTIILRHLVHAQVSFPRVMGLHLFRLLVAWIALAGLVGIGSFCVTVANRGRIPDYLMFYVLFMPLLVILSIFWSVLNWYFSLGVVCVAQYRSRNTSTGKLTLFFLAGRTGEVIGLTFLFCVMRIATLLALFVLAVLPSGIVAFTPVWPISLALCYFLVADFLYVSRLAAYLSLETYPTAAPGVVTFDPEESPRKMTVRIKL